MPPIEKVLWPCDRGTRAKLEILQRYLGAWFNILAANGVKDVIYFDGFCGAGEHEGGEKGSPVVATELANSVASKVSEFRVHIICIDSRAAVLAHLRNLPTIKRPHPRVTIDIRQGEFGQEIMSVVQAPQYLRHWPIFSFVDPFGFSGFSQTTLQLLMRNQSSEIFLNLWCGYMNRFVAHPDEQVQKCIADLIGADSLGRVANAADGIDEICDVFRENLRKLGPYVRRFMMRDEHNTRDNALFFCGHNERGLEKIKEAMWKADPVFGAGFSEYVARKSEGLGLLDLGEFDQAQTSHLRQILMEQFSGKTDVTVSMLKRWVIVETETFLPTHLRKELERLYDTKQISYRDPAPTGRKRRSGDWPDRLLVSFKA